MSKLCCILGCALVLTLWVGARASAIPIPIAWGDEDSWADANSNWIHDSGETTSPKYKFGTYELVPSIGIAAEGVVPEPATFLLIGSGLVGLLGFRLRQRRKQGKGL